MSSCNAKNIIIILLVGTIGFITSPWGMSVLYDVFPVSHNLMVRQMLPYSFIIFPFSLLFSMIAILMLILFIRATVFHCKNEIPEGSIIAEKLLALEKNENDQTVSNGNRIQFPEDYSSIEGFVYVVCGILLLWFYHIGESIWNHIAPLFGCVFLAAGLTVLVSNILSALFKQARHKYIVMSIFGIILCLIPFFINTQFWVYRFSIIPAGLLCFFIASYRLVSRFNIKS